MELGLPAPEPTVPIDIPPFYPGVSARWINGLWFFSLALALSAALIAMLAKEWLTAYLSSRPRPPRAHALLRQSRLEGLERWWALHIISLLPTMLHLSLLLFSIGLVVYLWTLDTGAAAVIAAVIGMTALFYVCTAVLGAIYDHCPYVTQVSGYIKEFSVAYMERRPRDKPQGNLSDFNSLRDLRALLWLSNNARDPAVVDCSYHALAGLRLPTGSTTSAQANESQAASSSATDHISGSPFFMKLDEHTTLRSLFLTLCGRFTGMVRHSEQLSESVGTSAARYLSAITRLASYMPSQHTVAANRKERFRFVDTPHVVDELDISALIEVLEVSNTIWSNQVPLPHADVSVSFLLNKLALLGLVLSNGYRATEPYSEPPLLPPANSPSDKAHELISTNIYIVHHESSPTRDRHMVLMRASYHHSLAQVNAVLLRHTQRKSPIGAATLNGLLDSLSVVTKGESIDPATYLMLFPRSAPSPAEEAPTATGPDPQPHSVPHTLASDLLGTLVALLKMSPEGNQESSLYTRIAAVRTVSALAPTILQQTLGLEKNKMIEEFSPDPWLNDNALNMNTARYVAARHMLLLIHHLGGHLRLYPEFVHICFNGADLINGYLFEDTVGTEGAWLALKRHGFHLISLLDSMGTSDSVFSVVLAKESFPTRLIALTRANYRDGTSLGQTILPPSCFPPLIRLIKSAQNSAAGLSELLQTVVDRMESARAKAIFPMNGSTLVETPGILYLQSFTRLAGGFSALAEAGLNDAHIGSVVQAATQIMRLAAGRNPKLVVKPIELHSPAVPGFLEAVTMVARHCIGVAERNSLLLEFSQDAITLLEVAVEAEHSREAIRGRQACEILYGSVEAVGSDDTANELMVRIAKIKSDLATGIEGTAVIAGFHSPVW